MLTHPDPKIISLLKEVSKFARLKKAKLYIVGGYLRDILLKRQKDNPDIDFALQKNAILFGRALSRKLKAGFVVLDKEHGCCRIVKRVDGEVCTLDFADFRGKDIEADLLHRDFTINALALELENIFKSPDITKSLIDPYGASNDLKSKLIKAVNPRSLDEDPLRVLRAFSLSAIFGFKISPQTLRLIKSKKAKLHDVSFERIRDELFKILGCADSYKYIVQMDELKVLKFIIPEIEVMRGVSQGPYHHLDVLRHSLESVRQFELLDQEVKRSKDIQNYLDEVLSADRKRRSLIKLGLLLHDVGKPKAKRRQGGKTKFHGHERIGLHITREVAKRLKLSNDELWSLEKMVFWHLRPGYLADSETITPRAAFRYFRDTAREGVSILLIAIADQRSTRGPLTSDESRAHHEKVSLDLIKECFKRNKEKKIPKVINGDDLMNKFKLSPSPLVGKILSEVEELQAIGKVKTKAEAFNAAAKLIKRSSNG